MKKLITLLLPLLMSVACSQPKEPIDLKELNEKEISPNNFEYFTKDTSEPYSGDVYSIEKRKSFNTNYMKKWEGKLVDGRKHGTWYKYSYEEDSLTSSQEWPFQNGNVNGVIKSYNYSPEKTLWIETNMKDGEEYGLQIMYYSNGQKAWEEFREGEYGQVTRWRKSYNENGSLESVSGDTTLKQ